MGMDKVSEAVLEKVKAEAESIIKEAEKKAREVRDKAAKDYETKLLAEKNRMLDEAGGEANRILAQATIRLRQDVLVAKTAVTNEIVTRVKKELVGVTGDEAFTISLIKEATGTLQADKIRVLVSPRRLSTIQKLIKEDKQLAKKVVEVKEYDCLGGALVEDIEGRVRIDNTYETRLEMLLPRLLPEISKELFRDWQADL